MFHSSIRSFIHSAPAPSGRPPLSARYAFPSGTGALGVRSGASAPLLSQPSSARPERVDDGPPHATGKDHEARDSYRGVHTGPVSHADRIHPSEPGNASFLAIAAAASLSPLASRLSPLTFLFSLFTFHFLLFTFHFSFLTFHFSLFIFIFRFSFSRFAFHVSLLIFLYF